MKERKKKRKKKKKERERKEKMKLQKLKKKESKRKEKKRIVEGIQNTIRGQRNDINNLPAPEYYERELYWRIWNKKKAAYDINPMLWINKLWNEVTKTTDKMKKQKRWEIKDNSINYLIICTIIEQWYIAKMERVSKNNWLGTRTEDKSEVEKTVKKYNKMKNK